MSDKESTVRSSSSNNTYLAKREVMFSPIHEHDEDELSVSRVHESCSNFVTEDTNSTILQFADEPTTVNNSMYKSTKV